MRRYRIEFSPDIPAEHTFIEGTAEALVPYVSPGGLDREDWDRYRTMGRGESLTIGGGATPITVITCIEE